MDTNLSRDVKSVCLDSRWIEAAQSGVEAMSVKCSFWTETWQLPTHGGPLTTARRNSVEGR